MAVLGREGYPFAERTPFSKCSGRSIGTGKTRLGIQTRLRQHTTTAAACFRMENYLLLCYENVPAEKLKTVKDVEVPWWGLFKRSGVKLVGDKILIVTPDKKIIWEWNSSDHLDVNRFSPVKSRKRLDPRKTRFRRYLKTSGYRCGRQRFKPANILYNPRNLDEIMLNRQREQEGVWSWTHSLSGGLSHPHSVYHDREGDARGRQYPRV